MKIAIPVLDQNMPTTICQSFGRTPYFLIYDTEAKSSVVMDNSAATSQGGAGIKAAQTVVDSKASALLTPRCGENADAVLRAAGVKIYKTVSDSIQENIDAFNEGRLELLGAPHPGLHGQGV